MKTIIQEIFVEVIKKHIENQKELFEQKKDISEFISKTKEILDAAGKEFIKETLEKADEIVKKSPERKRDWYVQRNSDEKNLLTFF